MVWYSIVRQTRPSMEAPPPILECGHNHGSSRCRKPPVCLHVGGPRGNTAVKHQAWIVHGYNGICYKNLFYMSAPAKTTRMFLVKSQYFNGQSMCGDGNYRALSHNDILP